MPHPIEIPHYVRCGTRYQDTLPSGQSATPPAICECGTYAIGACAECGKQVCGDDSQRVNQRRLCLQHVEEARIGREAQLIERQQAEEVLAGAEVDRKKREQNDLIARVIALAERVACPQLLGKADCRPVIVAEYRNRTYARGGEAAHWWVSVQRVAGSGWELSDILPRFSWTEETSSGFETRSRPNHLVLAEGGSFHYAGVRGRVSQDDPDVRVGRLRKQQVWSTTSPVEVKYISEEFLHALERDFQGRLDRAEGE